MTVENLLPPEQSEILLVTPPYFLFVYLLNCILVRVFIKCWLIKTGYFNDCAICVFVRWKMVDHYISHLHGTMQLLQQQDIIGRTSELARVFGIQFLHVLTRGSQVPTHTSHILDTLIGVYP